MRSFIFNNINIALHLASFCFAAVLPTASQAATWKVTQSNVTQFNSGGMAIAPGDTVVFQGSFTSLITPSHSGSAGAPIVLSFSGASVPGISFSSNQHHDIVIEGATYNGNPAGSDLFISLNYCYNLLISNCHVDNAQLIWGDSILNHDITIRNCWARTPSPGDGTDVDTIQIGDAYNVTIEGCYLENQCQSTTNGHQDVIQNYTKGGSNPGSPHNWVIRYNYLVTNDHTGGSGNNSFLMLQSMSGNPALRCYSNVFLVPSTATTGNNGIVVSRDHAGGVYYFYNNTVIRHSKAGNNTIRFEDTGTLYAENNVCMADPGVGGTGVSWTMTRGVWDHNFFYDFPTAGWINAGPNGLIGTNPSFANFLGNVFNLLPVSPLIGRGNNLGSEYASGIAPGAKWPNPTLAPRSSGAWDVGAYQSTSKR